MTPTDLAATIAAQGWTLHNLELAPGVWTLPGAPPFAEADARWPAIRRALAVLYPKGLRKRRIADLGCLEGGFSVELARLGARVTGIEARPDHIAKLRLVAASCPTLHLGFVEEDVKAFTAERHGTFAVVLACGILYHLDNPVTWLQQIAAATERVLILDTHFAPPDGVTLSPPFPLGPLERNEGAEGRWYPEYHATDPHRGGPWAAYSNERSFWLTPQALREALHAAGFDPIWEDAHYTLGDPQWRPARFARMLVVAVTAEATA